MQCGQNIICLKFNFLCKINIFNILKLFWYINVKNKFLKIVKLFNYISKKKKHFKTKLLPYWYSEVYPIKC